MPSNHFHAVRLGFNLLLVVEVIGLVFGLTEPDARSGGSSRFSPSFSSGRASRSSSTRPSRSSGRRCAPSSGQWSPCAGAVAVFALVGLFYRLQREGDEQTAEHTPELFAASKEAVALVVLVIFLILAGRGVSAALLDHEGPPRTTASSRASTWSWCSPT